MDFIQRIDKSTIERLLPKRNADTHKGNYGRILLLCGSRGYTGAAALAAMVALRTGAGLVYLGVPESIYEIEACKLLEPIVFPLTDFNGMLSSDAISKIQGLIPKMDAVLIGPGLGQSAETQKVVIEVLNKSNCPVVLDADGINMICDHINVLRGRKYPTILTPHDGEFVRLGGNKDSDRIEASMQMAKELNCILLRKGHHSIITDGSACYINHTGNPGMATGGSGDVLSGIIVSLLGQGLQSIMAAACGAWLHGAAGDLCMHEIGQYGMLPQDIVHFLPRLLP